MISVPVNTAHVGRMLEHVLRASQAEAIVVSPDLAARVEDVRDALPDLRVVLDPTAHTFDLDEPHTLMRNSVLPFHAIDQLVPS